MNQSRTCEQERQAVTTAKKRYQYYNLMIDIAFWSFLLQSIPAWLRMTGFHSYQSEGVWNVVSAIGFYGTWVLIAFLILARFMRDEYAQGLWQKAGATMIGMLTLLPCVLMLALLVAVIFLTDYADESTRDNAVEFIRNLVVSVLPSSDGGREDAMITAYLYGSSMVLFWTAIYQPFLFICLYKWQRWRDSR